MVIIHPYIVIMIRVKFSDLGMQVYNYDQNEKISLQDNLK